MAVQGHEHYMNMALALAGKAEAAGEVPVGAVVVNREGEVIGMGHNHPLSSKDPTAHAEIVAIREASRHVGNYRLAGSTLYCTIEPCPMCAGAILHARVEQLVFGAPDIKAGSAGSLYNLLNDPRLNHRVEVVRGVRDDECARLLQEFFQRRR